MRAGKKFILKPKLGQEFKKILVIDIVLLVALATLFLSPAVKLFPLKFHPILLVFIVLTGFTMAMYHFPLLAEGKFYVLCGYASALGALALFLSLPDPSLPYFSSFVVAAVLTIVISLTYTTFDR
jgi:hypothetical protein